MLQRLRLKLLWLRHTFVFRWAHKPLCARFEHDVVRLGPVHVCRSCTCLYFGMAFTAVLGLAGAIPGGAAFSLGFPLVLVATLLGSHPRRYWKWQRRTRDLLRSGAGCSIALTAIALVRGEWLLGGAALVILALGWCYYRKKRGAKKSHACDGCPELRSGQAHVCSGYQMQAARLRRYEEEATALLMSGQFVPDVVRRSTNH